MLCSAYTPVQNRERLVGKQELSKKTAWEDDFEDLFDDLHAMGIPVDNQLKNQAKYQLCF